MFGHHARKREKKRLAKQAKSLRQNPAQQKPPEMEKQKEVDNEAMKKAKIAESVQRGRENRKAATESGYENTANFLKNYDVEGLDPEKRQAMQYEANKAIRRNLQSANRQLLGEQSSRGIVGKGGVGYAQQRELQKQADESRAGVNRDLQKLNADLRLKKQAAIFAGGQGNAAQEMLDEQRAIDELNLEEEKKRQRLFEDQFYRQFSRV